MTTTNHEDSTPAGGPLFLLQLELQLDGGEHEASRIADALRRFVESDLTDLAARRILVGLWPKTRAVSVFAAMPLAGGAE